MGPGHIVPYGQQPEIKEGVQKEEAAAQQNPAGRRARVSAVFPLHRVVPCLAGHHGAADDHDLLEDDHEDGGHGVQKIVARGVVQGEDGGLPAHLEGKGGKQRHPRFPVAFHTHARAEVFRREAHTGEGHTVGKQGVRVTVQRQNGFAAAHDVAREIAGNDQHGRGVAAFHAFQRKLGGIRHGGDAHAFRAVDHAHELAGKIAAGLIDHEKRQLLRHFVVKGQRIQQGIEEHAADHDRARGLVVHEVAPRGEKRAAQPEKEVQQGFHAVAPSCRMARSFAASRVPRRTVSASPRPPKTRVSSAMAASAGNWLKNVAPSCPA